MLEEILCEGLAAMIPVYDGGNVTRVVQSDGTVVVLPRTCKTVMKNIARFYGVDLAATRRKYRRVVNKRQQIPIPFSSALLLIPLKMRKRPLGENDGTLGYVNFKEVEGVDEGSGACKVSLRCGATVDTLVRSSTVQEYIKNAKLVEKMFLDLHMPGTLGEAKKPDYGGDALGTNWGMVVESEEAFRAYLVGLLLRVLEGKAN